MLSKKISVILYDPCLNTLWVLPLFLKETWWNCDLRWFITHNPQNLWFVRTTNLGQKPKLGVWWKEKVNQKVNRSPLWPMILIKMEPSIQKKVWNQVCESAKKWVSGIPWKVNNGLTYEYKWEWWRKGKKVLFTPIFMRIKVTEPKWPYFYTHPYYKPWKDFFNLEWAETSVDWKIRANLWVKSCIVFIFVSVSIDRDSGAINCLTIVCG